MKNFNKILVIENDSVEISYLAQFAIKNEKVAIEKWLNFNNSFVHNKEENFKRLANLKDTLVVANPSFVGADNQFGSYLLLFYKLKELGIKLDIAIIYNESFRVYLLNFLVNSNNNASKKTSNMQLLKDVLEFHNIYEIIHDVYDAKNTIVDNTIEESSIIISWQSLMYDYVETDRHLGRTKFKIKTTGEIYEAYYINYKETDYVNSMRSSNVTLFIEDQPNNSFKLSELEKINN